MSNEKDPKVWEAGVVENVLRELGATTPLSELQIKAYVPESDGVIVISTMHLNMAAAMICGHADTGYEKFFRVLDGFRKVLDDEGFGDNAKAMAAVITHGKNAVD